MPNFNSIGSGVSEPQVARNRYLPLTGGIAVTTVYALTCYTVICIVRKQRFVCENLWSLCLVFAVLFRCYSLMQDSGSCELLGYYVQDG